MKYHHLAFLLVACLIADTAGAACLKPGKAKDTQTIERLEMAWTLAFLKGDTGFERCLLTPDFVEILKDGSTEGLDGELLLAEKNKGKDLPIPVMPKLTVHMHGDVAVAYGISLPKIVDGKPRSMRFADYYVWENGQWRVFFAQQTVLATEYPR